MIDTLCYSHNKLTKQEFTRKHLPAPLHSNKFLLSFTSREGNNPDDHSKLTYKKLLREVCCFANVLKSHGVAKGDRVALYMPMVLELPIAMLACARIGAVHSIIVSILCSSFHELSQTLVQVNYEHR